MCTILMSLLVLREDSIAEWTVSFDTIKKSSSPQVCCILGRTTFCPKVRTSLLPNMPYLFLKILPKKCQLLPSKILHSGVTLVSLIVSKLTKQSKVCCLFALLGLWKMH